MAFKNLGKKLKDIQQNITEEKIKKEVKEKRIRKGRKRIIDARKSLAGRKK